MHIELLNYKNEICQYAFLLLHPLVEIIQEAFNGKYWPPDVKVLTPECVNFGQDSYQSQKDHLLKGVPAKMSLFEILFSLFDSSICIQS